ncbi:DUF3644 domain-containing protein [Sulfitobacter sp. TCYB15]|uniref:DUF3644 domain-containing protein n=1 Tax=Sulfitobacter sp. TCYB15 TaxID=3229275 RepID=A0AAU8C5V5_9RHOB
MEFQQGKTGGLTKQEKSISKKLLNEGWTNQDVQAFINMGRPATVNFARISAVKSDHKQAVCTDEELELFKVFKEAFDPKTGLNPFLHERIVRSREAMITAISVFNNPTLSFRAETFAVLAITGWTYLALEYAERENLPTVRKNGDAISLADFLKFPECPFPTGVSDNLRAMIKLRDLVAHKIMGPYQEIWLPLFQACCFNFESQIVSLFSRRLSLAGNLSLSLQFGTFNPEQLIELSKSKLPSEIKAINSEILEGLTEMQKEDQAFQFSVVYTKVASSKTNAAYKFVSPESAEGKAIHDVLVKIKPGSETHPYKPSVVADLVSKATGKPFTVNDHTEAWKKHKVRPPTHAADKTKTNIKYCFYNPMFHYHCYNQAWVDKLVGEIGKQV